MKSIFRNVIVIVIILIATMLLFGRNNEDLRHQITTKFQKIVERKNQKKTNQIVFPEKDNFHFAAGQRESFLPDKKMQKRNESPGIRMARHQERMTDLQASGATPEKIKQVLRKEQIIAGTGSISGFVYQSDGKTPLYRSCRIEVYDEYGYYVGDDDLYGGDTTYFINELPSGLYYIRASSGYYINEYYDNVTGWREATLVQVVDGQKTSGIDFYLEKSKIITGHIYEEDGITPISNVYARFYLYDATSKYNRWDYDYYSTNLTENGEYTISRINYPEIKIKALVEGYAPEFYDNTEIWDDATDIAISGMNDTIPNINFSLSPFSAVQDGYEPNNRYSDAYEITYGDTVKPQINPENDIDFFKFNGQLGDTVTIDIRINVSSLEFYLYLIDSTGIAVLEYNVEGNENYILPYSGLYFLKVRSYGGGENHSYNRTSDCCTYVV